MKSINLLKKNIEIKPQDIIHHNHSLYMDGNHDVYTPESITESSQTSSFILAKAFDYLPLNPLFLNQIKCIQNKLGEAQTVYSVRFEKNEFTMEIYFYFPNTIERNSFQNIKDILNMNLEKPIIKEELPEEYGFGCISYNLENKKATGINLLGVKKGYKWKQDNLINTFSYYWEHKTGLLTCINQYYAYYKPNIFGDIYQKLMDSCTKMFPDTNRTTFNFFLKYPFLQDGDRFIYPMGIAEKKGAIGLYFYGLSVEQFIVFLDYFQYPTRFVEELKMEREKIKHIKYDIGIDFYITNDKVYIKKTTFFGTF